MNSTKTANYDTPTAIGFKVTIIPTTFREDVFAALSDGVLYASTEALARHPQRLGAVCQWIAQRLTRYQFESASESGDDFVDFGELVWPNDELGWECDSDTLAGRLVAAPEPVAVGHLVKELARVTSRETCAGASELSAALRRDERSGVSALGPVIVQALTTDVSGPCAVLRPAGYVIVAKAGSLNDWPAIAEEAFPTGEAAAAAWDGETSEEAVLARQLDEAEPVHSPTRDRSALTAFVQSISFRDELIGLIDAWDEVGALSVPPRALCERNAEFLNALGEALRA